MKNKGLQKIVLSKCQNSNTATEIYDLNGGIGLRTIKRWCQMVCQSLSIGLSLPSGCPRFVTTKGYIPKVKYCLRRKTRVLARKLSMERSIFNRSVRQIMKDDLGLRRYKIVIELLLSNHQKIKRKQRANWVRTKFRKGNIMRILFSDEKFFDIDDVYNSHND